MTTCQDMINALNVRYPQSAGKWANVVEFEKIDFMSVACWQSMGYAVHGHEIKVSRADWLRELKAPEKSMVNRPFCDFWWLAAPKGIAKEDEIPEGWGFMEWNGYRFEIVIPAPPLRPRFQRNRFRTDAGKAYEPNPIFFERRGFAMLARRYAYADADRVALLDAVDEPRPYLDAAAVATGRTTVTAREAMNTWRKNRKTHRKMKLPLR